MLDEVRQAAPARKVLNLEGPHTEQELRDMPIDELKRLAIIEARKAEEAETPATAGVKRAQDEAARQSQQAAAESAEAEAGGDGEMEYVATRTVDPPEGSNASPEVFEGRGPTREAALEDLLDNMARAKSHSTKKIREQQEKIRALESQQLPPLSGDDQYVAGQLVQQGDPRGVDLMIRKATGVGLQDIANTAKVINAQQQDNEVNAFLQDHPTYVDSSRNGAAMKMKMQTLGLPNTAANFHRAFVELCEVGLLELKGESSESERNENNVAQPRDEQGRFEARSPQEQEFAAQRQQQQPPAKRKAASGISSQNSTRRTPSVGISEQDAYDLPIDELRRRAAGQLKEQFGETETEERRPRSSGVLADRVR